MLLFTVNDFRIFECPNAHWALLLADISTGWKLTNTFPWAHPSCSSALSLSVFLCSRVTTSSQTFKGQPWDRLFFHTILRRSCGAVKSRAHCCPCLSLAAHASNPAFLASHQSSWHRQLANFSAARLPPTKWFLTYLNWSYHCVHCLLPCSVTYHFSPKSFRSF